MSRKTLRMNQFGESILSELDLLQFNFKGVHQKYPQDDIRNLDVCTVEFDWAWNGYDGYGKIDFYKSSMTVCNQFGENFSNMTISSKSRRQQQNGRHNCALYNDQSLENLFNYMLEDMLRDLDCSQILSRQEWIECVSKK